MWKVAFRISESKFSVTMVTGEILEQGTEDVSREDSL
jgi:hypothetical protein